MLERDKYDSSKQIVKKNVYIYTKCEKKFGIKTGEMLRRSQLGMDFIISWHTCAINCFLLTAPLLKPLSISFTQVKLILKQKNGKKRQKMLEL